MERKAAMDRRYYTLADVLGDEYRALRPAAAEKPVDTPAAGLDKEAVAQQVAQVQQRLLRDPQGLSALCLSGGGIRSATFALGVVQALARIGVLSRFDYLSTVSGGGYIGGWLSAWAQRHPEGIAGVSAVLAGERRSDGAPMSEPQTVRHLRDYSNYLAPRLGPLSVDAWTLVATYLRNLSLNWLVIIPLLLLVLMVPRLYATALQWVPDRTTFAAMVAVTALLMLRGLIYVGRDRPSAGARNRGQKEFLRGCLIPLGIAVLAISLCWAWYQRSIGAQFPWATQWWFIVPFAALIYILTWALHLFTIRARLAALWESKLREGAAALASGVVAGFLVWVWTRVFAGIPDSPLAVALYTCFAAPALWLVFTSSETVFVGLSSRVTHEDDREWWARSGAWILIALSLWTGLCLIVVFGPELLLHLWNTVATLGGVTGVLTYWAARRTLNARRTVPPEEQGRVTDNGGFSGTSMARIVLRFTAPLSVVAILVSLAYLSDWPLHGSLPMQEWAHLAVIMNTSIDSHLYSALIALLICLTMAPFINVNRFSLHSMYRNRLIRAYLGASRTCGPAASKTQNRFTGFDPADNLDMDELWPSPTAPAKARAPLHVVNIALNLVRGQELAWQQRKAASFTVTALHSGGCCVGYRSSDHYGDGISLGTAITISGAAASSSMGYHTTPSLSFLMSLFNARLGWWLGNPRDDKTWMKKGPDVSVTPLVDEMLGLTNDRNPWVYLSDGGHFDNLGLYEMIQRRCRLIVVSDAGADPQCDFEDLGNALRKIRADLGVRVELDGDAIGIRARSENMNGNRYCELFNIFYTESSWLAGSPEGRLLYIKPALCGGEPLDICNYAREHPLFPHEPTSDQFFAESQFESYRHLGEHMVETLVKGAEVQSLDDLFSAARSYRDGAAVCMPPASEDAA